MAQTFTINVSSDSVLIGNYIKVAFEIENLDGKFEAPFFDGMTIISGPNVSSSMQIINGSKTSRQTYTYLVKPEDIGVYTITPAYCVTADKTYETLPTIISVNPNPDNIIEQPESQRSNFFFNFDSPFGNLQEDRMQKKKDVVPAPNTKSKRKRNLRKL